MDHGRLPWPAPHELETEQRSVYDAILNSRLVTQPPVFRLTDDTGRLEGPFNAMVLAPSVGGAIQSLGSAIRHNTTLTAREREIAILTVAATRQDAFEWYAHERLARAAGLDEQAAARLGEGFPPEDATPREEALHAACVALLRDRDLSDDLLEQLRNHLTVPECIELITLIGYYDLLDLSLRVWRTPLPSGESSPYGASVGGPATEANLGPDSPRST